MRKIVFALATCSILASCVKEENKNPIDVSKTTYLMDGKWQLKMSTIVKDITDPLSFPEDTYAVLQECVKDNYFQFKSESLVTDYENVRCQKDQPDYRDLYYALEANEGYLKIWLDPENPDGSIVLAGDISYLSIDTFQVTYVGRNPNNEDLTSRFVKTYVKFK